MNSIFRNWFLYWTFWVSFKHNSSTIDWCDLFRMYPKQVPWPIRLKSFKYTWANVFFHQSIKGKLRGEFLLHICIHLSFYSGQKDLGEFFYPAVFQVLGKGFSIEPTYMWRNHSIKNGRKIAKRSKTYFEMDCKLKNNVSPRYIKYIRIHDVDVTIEIVFGYCTTHSENKSNWLNFGRQKLLKEKWKQKTSYMGEVVWSYQRYCCTKRGGWGLRIGFRRN